MKRSPVRYLRNERTHICRTNFNVNCGTKSMEEHEKWNVNMARTALKNNLKTDNLEHSAEHCQNQLAQLQTSLPVSRHSRALHCQSLGTFRVQIHLDRHQHGNLQSRCPPP